VRREGLIAFLAEGRGGGDAPSLTRPLLPKTCSTLWLPISKGVMSVAKGGRRNRVGLDRFEQEHGPIQELQTTASARF
jgi:hypothetical protein